jgi:hypothetical protein
VDEFQSTMLKQIIDTELTAIPSMVQWIKSHLKSQLNIRDDSDFVLGYALAQIQGAYQGNIMMSQRYDPNQMEQIILEAWSTIFSRTSDIRRVISGS